MSVKINSIEDHKTGSFSVSVNMGSIWRKFTSMADANKWLQLMRDTGCDEQFHINLREVVIMPRKELVYESSYVY